MGKQHLLHITNRAGLGGVTRYIDSLSRCLVARGLKVTVVAASGPDEEVLKNGDYQWLQLPVNGSYREMLSASITLRRYLQQDKVDVIHCHYRKSLLFSRLAGYGLNLPTYFTLHSTLSHDLKFPKLVYGDFVAHAPSAQVGEWLSEHSTLDPSRICVIPHGVPLDQFACNEQQKNEARNHLGLPKEAVVAGFVGRYTDQKNPDWIVSVAEKMRGHEPEPVFLMQGEGPLEAAVREKVAALGLESRFIYLPYGDPKLLYHAIDLLLLPSAYEGYALVGAEAMASGKPIVRTHTPGALEQVPSSEMGWVTLVDRHDFVETAARALSLGRAELHERGRLALRHAHLNLSLQKHVDSILQMYTSKRST